MNNKLKIVLKCPIPKFDFEVNPVGHVCGGLLAHRLR